ncbi:PTR2-domain-containing protein [Lojkania enalia]|uniref:PTR2-domain-containing protein n=1 Tax=Lojkania enalia TaxID=147567 RepID=A0A9P4KI61_9PLEO|nr:PTR2-domain-containing protein [Didymosphaeria enalia]
MSSGANLDFVEAATGELPGIAEGYSNEKTLEKSESVPDNASDELMGPNGEQYPTAEEMQTLRRVYGKIDWMIYIIGIVEMCERFAYYGTTAVFVNFVQQDLPTEGPHPSAGAAGTDGQAGALGLGQRTSTSLVLFNQFWSYIMPMIGGWLADEYWGRFKTIYVAIVVASIGHILIIIAAIPSVIQNPDGALASFVLGLVLFGSGVGFFKCNISPLIAEQYEASHPKPFIRVEPNGERVIVDPGLTISRVYLRYYQLINVGALVGQISMVYAEKYVGFWLSFTLPTILFLFCPLLMIVCSKYYVRRPPTGSVLSKATKLYGLAMRGRWSANPITTWKNLGADDVWESAKPSRQERKPGWMTFDDAWVDEVRRGFKACHVFLWYPIYWLSYGQMTTNLVSQAATMKLNGVPNDVVNNLNPFALIIFIPVFDKFIYPSIAHLGLNFTPLKKVHAGFACGMLSMVVAAIIQHYIYTKSPCGKYASSCDADSPPDLSVWVQTPAYLLIAFSEIFASITGLEYAFTKAPRNMRSLVTGVFWFTHAFSAALSQAFVPLADDPLLVWLYTTIAVITAVGGIAFWWTFRSLDHEDDELNALPEGAYRAGNDVPAEAGKVQVGEKA